MASLNVKLRVVQDMINRWGPDFDPHRKIRDGNTPITVTKTAIMQMMAQGGDFQPFQEMLSLLEGALSVTGTANQCSACHAPNAEKKCPCNAAWYCSVECQKEHWLRHRKDHKSLMKQRTTANEGAAASADEAGGRKKKKRKKKKKKN